MTPGVPIVSSAYALVADTLQGKSADQFIQVADGGTSALTQANTGYAFSTTNWPKLKALIDGASTQYQSATPTGPLDYNGQRLTDVGNPVNPQDGDDEDLRRRHDRG